MTQIEKISGLYAIVDPEATCGRDPADVCQAVAGAGAGVIQLRAKTMAAREMFELARRMQDVCSDSGALFIVNDRLDVALAAGAGGVHLGQEDLPLAAARRIAGPGFIIGTSTHSLAEARLAQQQGASYIGFGAMYPTATKANVTNPQGPARLREIAQAASIPVVAIGGITLERLPEIKAAGAAAAAVISAVCGADSPGDAALRMIQAWREA